MATYLQGVTDYIPQVQPFAPDFNFYAKSLQFSQGKHDAARKQLSNIYGSLLNAPLTREDNTEARDKFFKTIDQDIQKMAGMDLSLNQNVHAAKGVFNQMLDNKAIVKDMVWSKQWQGQMRKSQSFKNCVDPEKCGGAWWEGGDKALQYNRQEFMNASAEDAMGMGVQEFVSYQDVTKRALAMAKEADLNVSIDQVTGQWITTTKNGPQLIGKQLQSLFMGSIGKDPKVKQYYETKASNQRKDFMYGNKDQYGSLEAAEQAYLQEVTPTLEKYYGEKKVELEDAVAQNEKKVKKINEAIENAPADKRSEMEKLRDELQGRGKLYDSSLEDVTENEGQVAVAQRNQRYSGRQADAMLAGIDLHNEIGKAAEVMSYRNYEQSVAVNPYGMEAVQQRNRLKFEALKQHNRKELERYKLTAKGEYENMIATGGAEANNAQTITDVAGSSAVGNMDPASAEYKSRVMNQFSEERDEHRIDVSGNELSLIEQTLQHVTGAAEGGDAQAREDYVNIFNSFNAAVRSSEENVRENGAEWADTWNELDAMKLQQIALAVEKANTIDEKYAIAKQYKANWKDMVSGGQIDMFYEKGVMPLLDRNKGNDALRDYLSPVYALNQKSMLAIETKKKGLELMDSWVADNHESVMTGVNGDGRYTKMDRHALQSYVDDKGHVVPEDVFIANMMKKGYTEQQAVNKFRGDVESPYSGWLSRETQIGLDYVMGGFGESGQENAEKYLRQERLSKGRGIHSLWTEAFSQHANPEGDQAWLGLTGAGDLTAMGQRYSTVDPAQYKSIGTMGINGALNDALNSKNAIFRYGGFENTIQEDIADVRNLADQLRIDMGTMTNPKTVARPMLDVTSVQVAGGNSDYMAVNVKMSEMYRKKYKGSENSPGIMGQQLLSNEGFTMYIPKNEATNLFYTGSQKTVYEQAMNWKKEIPFDAYPNYFKDTKLTSTPSGAYKFAGYGKVTNEDGTTKWEYFQKEVPYSKDLNGIVDTYTKWQSEHAALNMAGEEQIRLNNQHQNQ